MPIAVPRVWPARPMSRITRAFVPRSLLERVAQAAAPLARDADARGRRPGMSPAHRRRRPAPSTDGRGRPEHTRRGYLPRITLAAELDAIVRRGGELVARRPLRGGRQAPARRARPRPTAAGLLEWGLQPDQLPPRWVGALRLARLRERLLRGPVGRVRVVPTLSYDAWGWGTGAKSGTGRTAFSTRRGSRAEFAPCACGALPLAHTARISVDGAADAVAREHMLRLLEESVADATGHR